MSPLLSLAWHSAWNRRFALSLTLLSVALSAFLLLSIEQIRTDVRRSFAQSVSGTDLIVGPRTGPAQLLLYTVFHMGSATTNMQYGSVQALARHPAVEWVVPFSLGDSHQGFPVIGTEPSYFDRFRYGDRQALVFRSGARFQGLFDAVVGAEVAQRLGHRLGTSIVLSHGDGALEGTEHADKPFTVVGVLARTGTPVDRSIHISLQAMEALHADWIGGAPLPGFHLQADQLKPGNLQPRSVTAALVGLKSRVAVFAVQRWVSEFQQEPLMGILPGVALHDLWEVVGAGEKALFVMTTLVATVSLAGLIAVILVSINERRRELAILRSVGASPRAIWLLLSLEGGMVTLAGAVTGWLASVAVLAFGAGWIQERFGISLRADWPGTAQGMMLGALLLFGWLASLLPGWRAYRLSLADGLTPRI